MTTSKIKLINSVKEWTGKYGSMFTFKVEMENGDIGDINKKERQSLSVGSELTYEIQKGEYGNKFVEEKKKGNFAQGNSGYSRNYKADFISFSASYIKDLIVSGNLDRSLFEVEADRMFNRMCKKYDGLKAIAEPQEQDTKQEPKHETSDKVTESQVSYIMSLWSGMKITDSETVRKKYLKEKFGVDSTKDLSKEQASSFIEDLKTEKIKKSLEGSDGAKKAPAVFDDDMPF